jgi:hypothetical protein
MKKLSVCAVSTNDLFQKHWQEIATFGFRPKQEELREISDISNFARSSFCKPSFPHAATLRGTTSLALAI